jgi:hypothetical protein
MKIKLTLQAKQDQFLIFLDDQNCEITLPTRYFKELPLIGQSLIINFDHATAAQDILQTIFNHHDKV